MERRLNRIGVFFATVSNSTEDSSRTQEGLRRIRNRNLDVMSVTSGFDTCKISDNIQRKMQLSFRTHNTMSRFHS